MMTLSADVNGETLAQALHASREELSSHMDSSALLAAVGQDGSQFTTWVAKEKWSGLSDTVALHLGSFFEVSLLGVLAGAWCKFKELREQAEATGQDDKLTSNVALADHEFSYGMEPTLDVLLDGKKVGELPLKADVIVTIGGLELVLKGGCVHRVHTGTCQLTGAVECAGKEVWRSKPATLDLPGEFQLMKPLRLNKEAVEKLVAQTSSASEAAAAGQM